MEDIKQNSLNEDNEHIYYNITIFNENKEGVKNRAEFSETRTIPILNKSHKLALFFRPLAFEGFDFSDYDIVVTSTSAESK